MRESCVRGGAAGRVGLAREMRLALAGAAACALGLFSGAAAAQSLPGDAFLSAVTGGAVWCVDYRASDSSCSFVLRAPQERLASDGPITEADGLAMLDLGSGGAPIKMEQRFRYFVEAGRVCLRGADVRPEDVRFYDPSTRAPFVSAQDQRLPPQQESPMRDVIASIWAENASTCWSYRLEERVAERRGLEIAMTRHVSGRPEEDAGFGVFFEPDEIDSIRLRP